MLNWTGSLILSHNDSDGIGNITNIYGLQYFRQVITIELNDQLIEDLSPLSQLYSLQSLSMDNNSMLTDLSPLFGLINFSSFSCYECVNLLISSIQLSSVFPNGIWTNWRIYNNLNSESYYPCTLTNDTACMWFSSLYDSSNCSPFQDSAVYASQISSVGTGMNDIPDYCYWAAADLISLDLPLFYGGETLSGLKYFKELQNLTVTDYYDSLLDISDISFLTSLNQITISSVNTFDPFPIFSSSAPSSVTILNSSICHSGTQNEANNFFLTTFPSLTFCDISISSTCECDPTPSLADFKVCNNGVIQCAFGYTRVDNENGSSSCIKQELSICDMCSINSQCTQDAGSTLPPSCECKNGWYGDTCRAECPTDSDSACNGQGTCDNGVCECADNWYGYSCGFECPVIVSEDDGSEDQCGESSGHGNCDVTSNVCSCESEYEGEACEYVRFTNSTLKTAICDVLSLSTCNIIPSQMENLISLSIIDEISVTDLFGLKFAVNLEELTISGADLSDFDALLPISELLYLDYLNISDSNITDFDNIPSSVSDLDLSNSSQFLSNSFQSISSLFLSSLNISNTGIFSLSFDFSESNLVHSLSILNISGNSLENLSFLGDFIELTTLNISDVQVGDIPTSIQEEDVQYWIEDLLNLEFLEFSISIEDQNSLKCSDLSSIDAISSGKVCVESAPGSGAWYTTCASAFSAVYSSSGELSCVMTPSCDGGCAYGDECKIEDNGDASCQSVIVDPGLRAHVGSFITEQHKLDDMTFSMAALQTLTSTNSLSYSSSELTDLRGIEHMIHLTELDLSDCSQLSNVFSLHSLVGLQHLDLSNCALSSSVNGLSNLI
ncbi:hypothetical protein ADUPG1_006533, partial [Aduncisulcus paluster]